jgi:hypothetical protein
LPLALLFGRFAQFHNDFSLLVFGEDCLSIAFSCFCSPIGVFVIEKVISAASLPWEHINVESSLICAAAQ